MAVRQRKEELPVKAACEALSLPRSTFYRETKPRPVVEAHQIKRVHPRALTQDEKNRVLGTLNSPRFVDTSPTEVYATLLDEGVYLCSERSMYRILAKNKQNTPRRQRPARNQVKPELLATAPNQLWSWDITKLKGPAKWTYYYLYVILDVFSRYVVGWMVAFRESAVLARHLIEETCEKQEIIPGQLTIHGDHGSPMIAKTTGQLLADLGITKTHSRPHVSNDNPYSESGFKTLKYRPGFPGRFGGIEDAKAFCRDFFNWYNTEHRHSGITLLTPEDVHYGRTEDILGSRGVVLEKAYELHPERFVKGVPSPGKLLGEVWINKPESQKDAENLPMVVV